MLQRIDLHPIGEIDGAEVDRFGHAALDPLLGHRILVQRSPLAELDGCPVQWREGKPEGERPPEEVAPRLLSTYEIDVLALRRALRRANQLAGPPVEESLDLAHFVGHRGNGRQRRSVCLVRLLRDDNIQDVVWTLRARIATGTLLLLTPRVVELRRRTLEHLAAGHAFVLSILDGLDRETPHSFALKTAVLARGGTAPRSSARLQIDAVGGRATLDGREMS